jgi:hypothetical protein
MSETKKTSWLNVLSIVLQSIIAALTALGVTGCSQILK